LTTQTFYLIESVLTIYNILSNTCMFSTWWYLQC